jgi:hypothetical protein
MNAMLLTLIATVLLSAFALAGCGLQQAQAEPPIEEFKKRINERIEELEKRLEVAQRRIEVAQERIEERAEEEERTGRATQGESPNAGETVLRIEGDPRTEFSGSCAVGDQEGEAIAGRVPQSFDYELHDRRLECEIRNESGGDMEVVLEAGNDRSVQRTNAQGATIRLTYSEGSISSSTISSSGSGLEQVSSLSSQRSDASSSQTQVIVTD